MWQADVTVTNDCWSQRWQRLPNGSYPLLSGPNLGLAFLRNTPPTRRLMDAWLACKASNDSWDQKCFQQVGTRCSCYKLAPDRLLQRWS